MLDQPCCQNPACGLPLTFGHRPRKYCNNACKQAAHRARLREAKRVREEDAHLARIQGERESLIRSYGHLLPQTLDLLQSLQAPLLIEKIIMAIRAEQEWARQTELQERNALIEHLLLTGEQLGFPRLGNDDFILEAGLDSWLTFTQHESLPWLYLARDILHIKILAANGRKHLLQLAPQA